MTDKYLEGWMNGYRAGVCVAFETIAAVLSQQNELLDAGKQAVKTIEGFSAYERKVQSMALVVIKDKERKSPKGVPVKEVTDTMYAVYGIVAPETEKAIDALLRKTSELYEPKHGFILTVKPHV